MFKSWNAENSPILPIIHIEHEKDKTLKLWLHTNSIAERLEINKKLLEMFMDKSESFPLLKNWQNYLTEPIINSAKFNLGKKNEAISICIHLSNNYEIINWSFHLTLVKCSFIVENKIIEALLSRKNKTRYTVLKFIKEYIEDLDSILRYQLHLEIATFQKGKFELSTQTIIFIHS